MADDDTNLPDAYDLVSVDHQPQFADAPVPKAGQTVPQPNVMGDISSMPGKVASAVGDVTGISDAYKAATGQMTPEEAQMFALGALPMLAGGPEAKVAEEAAPFAAKTLGEFSNYWENQGIKHSVSDLPQRGQYNLGQVVVPKDQRGQGVGSQFMQGLTDLADANGRTVTLTPSTDFGGSSVNRLKDFYKDFGFVENKGRNKDFSISDSMYRPPTAPAPAPEPPPPSIRAYHGSPYDFNQFDLSKIGTGEGAQAYGHGLYFAENPGTAKAYQVALANDPDAYKINGTLAEKPSPEFAAARLVKQFGEAPETIAGRLPAGDPTYADVRDTLLKWGNSAPDITPGRGNMYEVNINADPEHFLDWDKPLSEQSDQVKNTLAQRFGVAPVDKLQWSVVPSSEGRGFRVVNQLGGETGGALYERDAQKIADNANARPAQSWDPTGKEVYDHIIRKQEPQFGEFHSVRETTPVLRDAGIPGIKYLDQGSRNVAADQREIASLTSTIADGKKYLDSVTDPIERQRATDALSTMNGRLTELQNTKHTSNYVVFNDKLIDIVKKYGLAGLVAGGASHFSTVPVDHQPDFPDQNGMADGGTVDDATDPNNSIAPLATALNQAVPNFDPEAAGFRPSTNIEDVRNKPLWRKAIETITRKPLPGDLTNYAKGGGVKATKTQANYRGGTAKKRCGICSMFQPPRGCSAVRGVISPQALCDFYEPKKAEKKNDVKIDVTHDGPWMSCMSIDGATMYRNKNIPATANIKGKTVDVDDMLLHHEVPEREDLENLIAEFKKKFNRDPNTKERKGIYLKAHNRSGTPNEREHAREIGVDWKSWSAWCRGEESKIEKMKFTNQPKDADVKPIPHSHDELEAMDHASAA